MPATCLFPSCNSRKGRNHGSDLHFFNFPQNGKRRLEWFHVCGVNPDRAPKMPVLCSEHFSPSDLYFQGRRYMLKDTAVPISKFHQDESSGATSSRPPLRSITNAPLPLVLPAFSTTLATETVDTSEVASASLPITEPGEHTYAKSAPTSMPNLLMDKYLALKKEMDALKKEKHQLLVRSSIDNHEAARCAARLEREVRLREVEKAGFSAELQRQAELMESERVKFQSKVALVEKEKEQLQREVHLRDEEKERLQQEWREEREQVEQLARDEVAKIHSENVLQQQENAKLLKALQDSRSVCDRRGKTIKNLSQQLRRCRTTIEKLLKKGQSKQCLDYDDGVIRVRKCLTNDTLMALLRRMSGIDVGEFSNPHLRVFAVTLHFYSPAAYRYIRKALSTDGIIPLPSERTLTSWFSTTDVNTGFTPESFECLKLLAHKKGKRLPVTVVLDDMSIKKRINVVGSSIVGCLDYGERFQHLMALRKEKSRVLMTQSAAPGLNRPPPATEVCVLMVVCLDQGVKIPVGYLLHDKLNGKQLKSIVTECIKDLHDIGVTVKAVVSDGASQNRAMARFLGANIEPVVFPNKKKGRIDNGSFPGESRYFRPYFSHPCDASIKIYIIMDVCHMLKLVRNTLASRKRLLDADGNVVSWYHITALHDLQKREGLRLGNRLADAHVAKWDANKMKVSVAAQTLSNSVAKSLIFCNMIGINNFEEAPATAKFLSVFNSLFDILNSFNLKSPGFKAPMTVRNEALWRAAFDDAKKYIYGLKVKDKYRRNYHSIFDSKRKVGFQGFIVAIESVKMLFDDLVRNGDMNFLCTYKLSQDHLEAFFGKVRQRRGPDNNPTATHFKAAYRSLLCGAEVTISKCANVMLQDCVPILNSKKTNSSVKSLKLEKLARRNEERSSKVGDIVALGDHFSSSGDPMLSSLTKFSLAIVSYAGGFVAKRLKEKYCCSLCDAAMCTLLGDFNSGDVLNFIELRSTNNGLTVPTKDLVVVCASIEEKLRRGGRDSVSELYNVKCNESQIINEVRAEAKASRLFEYLVQHHHKGCSNIRGRDDLVIDICHFYFKIRKSHICKLFNDLMIKEAIRHKYNRLVLHSHQ